MNGVDGVRKGSQALMVCLWKSIRWEWLMFSRFIHFDVGNGTRVKFWHDLWCGDCPLKEAFLELYRICCDKESSIDEDMHFPNGTLSFLD